MFDPITVPHGLSLSLSPTRSRTFSYMLSPSPPITSSVVPVLTPLLQDCVEHKTEESPSKVYALCVEHQINTPVC